MGKSRFSEFTFAGVAAGKNAVACLCGLAHVGLFPFAPGVEGKNYGR